MDRVCFVGGGGWCAAGTVADAAAGGGCCGGASSAGDCVFCFFLSGCPSALLCRSCAICAFR